MNNDVVEIKINEHDETIKEHENRIGTLEKSDVKHTDSIENLCEKIDNLIISQNKIFYALICGMAGILVKIVFFK